MSRIKGFVGAVLDEAGYVQWGGGRSTDSTFEGIVRWAQAVQQAGKPYFSINELHEQNLTDSSAWQWIVASHLVANEGLSAIWIGGVQAYGPLMNTAYLGRSAEVGSPLGTAVMNNG